MIDYTTYLGPYVLCKTEKVLSTKEISTCSNTSCQQHEQEVYSRNFCDRCGHEIKKRQVPIEVDNVDEEDVRLNLLDEALCTAMGDEFYLWMEEHNTHIWLSNRKIPDVRDLTFDTEEIQFVPIDAKLIAEEVQKFSDFYEKELVILREEYGEENVEVQWGLVHFIS